MDEQEVFSGNWQYDTAEDINHTYRFAPPVAAYLVIQPIVGLLDNLSVPTSAPSYLENPLILQDGGELSWEEYNVLAVAPLEWRQSIINKYGDLVYRDISWALKRLYVEDLHSGNIGWLGDTPVIIDWLSYQDPPTAK